MTKQQIERLNNNNKRITEVIGRLTVLAFSDENIKKAHEILLDISNDIDDLIETIEENK